MNLRFLSLFVVWMVAFPAAAAFQITATITFTNAGNLTNAVAISNALMTVNSDTRTYTNAVFDPATQIRIATNIGTNIAQQVQQTLVHVATHPFSGLRPTSDGVTYVALRGTNDQVIDVVFAPTNYASVTYATQTVGAATFVVRVPVTVEAPSVQTNVASGLNQALNLSGNTNRFLSSFNLTWASELFTNITTGVNSNLNFGTNVLVRLEGPTDAGPIVGITNSQGFVNGLYRLLFNAGQRTLYITNESPMALAENRILTPDGAATSIPTNGVLSLMYDTTTNRWFVVSSGGGSGGSSGGTLYTSNAVWVAKNGSDATGERGNMSKPFLTLLMAKTNAAAGDTIFVLPGVYTNNQSLLKSNVNWHFFSGAFVTNLGVAVFGDDGIGNIPSVITGDGSFYNVGGGGCVSLWSNSVVNIKCKLMSGGNPVVSLVGDGSDLAIEGEIATSTANGVSIDTTTGLLTLNRCRIFSSSATANSPAVRFNVANTNAIFRDCTIVTSGGTNSIGHGAVYPVIRVYGWLMAKTNIGPRINFYVGTNNVTVNGDVK